MPEPELSLIFIRPFNELGIRYMVGGSIAAIFYGEPRLTNDVDLIVFLKMADISSLQRAFPSDEYYLPPPEVIGVEIAREERGHFNIIHLDSGFKADCYTSGLDKLHIWALSRARKLPFRGEDVILAPPEYVIIRKLEYFREGGSQKHVRDLRSILAISGPTLDRIELQRLIAERNLDAEWKTVLSEIP